MVGDGLSLIELRAGVRDGGGHLKMLGATVLS
jgi:hypothetical protein